LSGERGLLKDNGIATPVSMQYDSDDDLEDGPVLRVKPDQAQSDKMAYLRQGLQGRLNQYKGSLSWTNPTRPTMLVTFARQSPCWHLEIRVVVGEAGAGWAVVNTDWPKLSVSYNQQFTQRDVCLGYILHMIDITSKIGGLMIVMDKLTRGGGFPIIEAVLSKEGQFPIAKINMEKAGALSRALSVTIRFDMEEAMWARVEVTTREHPQKHTAVYCKDERDTVNYIVSSMDLGVDMDYYNFAQGTFR
jgi:hypothetical protein